MMKQILLTVCLLCFGISPLCARETKPEKKQFNPHWYLQLQGGAGHTLGESDFDKLISPAAAISAARQFTPVWALRFGVSGWQAKGAWFTPNQVYKFNFMQVNADVVVDLANWIGGFKYNRTVNPYVFVGLGGNIAFNNDEAKAVNDSGYKLRRLWGGTQVMPAGRAGAGVNFRLCDCMSLGLEVNTNMLPDKFNSKRAGNVDWQMNVLAGLTFRIGKNYKQTALAAMPISVANAAPAPVVEPAPAPVAVVEQPTPAPVVEPAPAPVAPALPSNETYKTRQDVFFAINSSNLRDSENAKIEALVECLKTNPKSCVSVVGYADAPTGTSIGNYWLSGWRAIRVRDALKDKGIAASRIKLNFLGDKEQPHADVDANRVVVCIVR